MYILGDIGNSETKIFLVSNRNKIVKKISFSSKEITINKLKKYLTKINLNSKILKRSYFVVLSHNALF